MANIIGLNQRDGKRVMVNTDHILFFQAIETDGRGGTEVLLTGGVFLYVDQDMYDIVEMIDRGPDYYATEVSN